MLSVILGARRRIEDDRSAQAVLIEPIQCRRHPPEPYSVIASLSSSWEARVHSSPGFVTTEETMSTPEFEPLDTIKIGRHLIDVPASSRLLRDRINHRMHGRPVQLLADLLAMKYPNLSAVDAIAGTGENAALVCHRTNIPTLCIEPRRALYQTLVANLSSIVGCEFIQTELRNPPPANGPSAEGSSGSPPATLAQSMSLDEVVRQRTKFIDSHLVISGRDDRTVEVLRSGWHWLSAATPALCFRCSPRILAPDSAEAVLFRDLVQIGYRQFLLFDDRGNFRCRLDQSLDDLPAADEAGTGIAGRDTPSSYLAVALSGSDLDIMPAMLDRLDSDRPPGEHLRIAVVRLDNLGDHVLGSGLFGALRSTHPSAEVSLVVPEAVVQLYARCPCLDHVIVVPSTYARDPREFNAFIAKLSQFKKFDVVINPRFAEDGYFAGLIAQAMAAGGGRVLGFRQTSSPIAKYDPNLYYNELVEASDELHSSRYAGLMMQRLTSGPVAADPQLWWSTEDEARVRSRCRLAPQRYVVVGCGASFPFKLPELDVYHHIVRELTGRWNREVVLIGTRAERDFALAAAEAAVSPARVVCTCGELRLPELGALLHAAELYIGPDAGPMHMAAAAGAKVIEIAWVPEDYRAKSRGKFTGGRCWAPFSPRAISVRPAGAIFAEGIRHHDWPNKRIRGLSPAEIDRSLASMLEADGHAAGSSGMQSPPHSPRS